MPVHIMWVGLLDAGKPPIGHGVDAPHIVGASPFLGGLPGPSRTGTIVIVKLQKVARDRVDAITLRHVGRCTVCVHALVISVNANFRLVRSRGCRTFRLE